MKYWLMKSEPNSFSFNDLKNAFNHTTPWDGVRNYQARNFMKDEMKIGDIVLFYHSNCAKPAVVGLGMVASKAYPDFTQFDINSKYFDGKSSQGSPRWFLVDIKYLMDLPKTVTLSEIRKNEKLNNMLLVKKGMRLSIQPVKDDEFKEILNMAGLTEDKVFEEHAKVKKSI